jgi:hypothetical protein
MLVKNGKSFNANPVSFAQILFYSYKYADSSLDCDNGFVWTNAVFKLQRKFPGNELSKFPYGNFRNKFILQYKNICLPFSA